MPATSGALPVLAGRPTDGLPCRIAVCPTAPRARRAYLPRPHLAFVRAQKNLIDKRTMPSLCGHHDALVLAGLHRPNTR